jgi:hypothetical protein
LFEGKRGQAPPPIAAHPESKFLEKKLYLTYFGVYEEFSLSDKYKLCFNKNKIECFSIVFLD